MIINQSQVAMSSQRTYVKQVTDSYSVENIQKQPIQGQSSNKSINSFADLIAQMNEPLQEGLSNNYSPEEVKKTGLSTDGLSANDSTRLRFQTMNYLLRILFYKHAGGDMSDLDGMDWQEMYGAVSPTNYMAHFNHTSTYYESETTSFSTTGKVVTADGREIEFGIDVSMSRSFYAETSQDIETQLQCIDPLVINLDSNPTSVSDMKFEFDLDGDGSMENVSLVSGSSAFLALDKNGNGEIDDGSELFGTKSGDGFRDLAEYDTDGNGWIDEADEIFDKLRLWQVNEDGTKTLYTLKDKGVGALYLGSIDSKFSLTTENNDTNAIIRKSGVYLREDGTSGTMAHVDLVS